MKIGNPKMVIRKWLWITGKDNFVSYKQLFLNCRVYFKGHCLSTPFVNMIRSPLSQTTISSFSLLNVPTPGWKFTTQISTTKWYN